GAFAEDGAIVQSNRAARNEATRENTRPQETRRSSNNPTRSTSSRNNPANVGPMAPPQGLNPRDLAAVAQLGGSLRNLGNQVQTVTPAQIVPDTRTQTPQPDPNNPTRPGGNKGISGI
ncbi:MAG: hypothetical protein K2Q01_02380, partial [Rickettsiales bacterium]|nr:hypothetical protein [Rickettsiales bacterium]